MVYNVEEAMNGKRIPDFDGKLGTSFFSMHFGEVYDSQVGVVH